MGKRQLRIFQKDILAQREQLVGKKAQVVLESQATFFGTILDVQPTYVLIKDMRLKPHQYPIGEVAELMLDYDSVY